MGSWGLASVEVADCHGDAGSRGRVADRGRDGRRDRSRRSILRGRFGALAGVVVRGSLVAQASGAQCDLRSWLAVGVDAGDANGNVSPWTQCAVDCCHRRGDVHPHLGRGVSAWRSTNRHGAAIGCRRLRLVDRDAASGGAGPEYARGARGAQPVQSRSIGHLRTTAPAAR